MFCTAGYGADRGIDRVSEDEYIVSDVTDILTLFYHLFFL